MKKVKAPTTYDLGNWAQAAERGESFVYGRITASSRPTEDVMNAARRLHEAGLVALVSKREGEVTNLIAQRTWKTWEETQKTPIKRTVERQEPRTDRRCAVRGCARPLKQSNTSGVCQEHLHRIGVCQCQACAEMKV